jgi:hypothetical protein
MLHLDVSISLTRTVSFNSRRTKIVYVDNDLTHAPSWGAQTHHASSISLHFDVHFALLFESSFD